MLAEVHRRRDEHVRVEVLERHLHLLLRRATDLHLSDVSTDVLLVLPAVGPHPLTRGWLGPPTALVALDYLE
jgi:hypothetical protein